MDEKKRVMIELKAEIGDEVFFLADAPNGFRGKIPMHGKVVGYHLEADRSEGTELMTAVLYAVHADGSAEGDPYEVPGSLLCATAAGAIEAAQQENVSRWALARALPPIDDRCKYDGGGLVPPELVKRLVDRMTECGPGPAEELAEARAEGRVLG